MHRDAGLHTGNSYKYQNRKSPEDERMEIHKNI